MKARSFWIDRHWTGVSRERPASKVIEQYVHVIEAEPVLKEIEAVRRLLSRWAHQLEGKSGIAVVSFESLLAEDTKEAIKRLDELLGGVE